MGVALVKDAFEKETRGRRRQALFKRNGYLDVLEFGVLKPQYLRRFHPAAPERSSRAAVTR